MRARGVVIALGAMLVAACAPGTPDIGFTPSGTIPYGIAAGGTGARRTLVPTADGGVIATAGGARPLTRITAEGVVDEAWGSTLPNDCRNTSGAIATGTSVLFTCSHLPTSGPQVWQMWRVTAAGVLDPTFGGGDGIVDLPSTINQLEVAALPNGGYLGLGYADVPPSRTSVTPLIAIVFSSTGTTLSTTQIDIPVTPIGPTFWERMAHQCPSGVNTGRCHRVRAAQRGHPDEWHRGRHHPGAALRRQRRGPGLAGVHRSADQRPQWWHRCEVHPLRVCLAG